MTWSWRLGALVWLSCLACSKRDLEHRAGPEAISPRASASAPTMGQLAPPAPELRPLAFELVKVFGDHAGLSRVGDALLVCDNPIIALKGNPKERHVFLFDGDTVQELAGFLSDKDVNRALGGSIVEKLRHTQGGQYSFRGTWPHPLYLRAYGYYDDDGNARDGFESEEAIFERQTKGWTSSDDTVTVPDDTTQSDTQMSRNGLPRVYDDDLLHAPSVRGLRLVGGGGPLMVLSERSIDHFDGRAPARRLLGG